MTGHKTGLVTPLGWMNEVNSVPSKKMSTWPFAFPFRISTEGSPPLAAAPTERATLSIKYNNIITKVVLLDFIGYHIGCTVFSCQHGICFCIVPKTFCLRIEFLHSPEPIGYVSQMSKS